MNSKVIDYIPTPIQNFVRETKLKSPKIKISHITYSTFQYIDCYIMLHYEHILGRQRR